MIHGTLNDGLMKQVERASVITGLAASTLEQCKRVAKAYLLEERVEGATWKMHEDVISLPKDERFELLKKAVDDKWEHVRWRAATAGRKQAQQKRAGIGVPVHPDPPRRVPMTKTGVVKRVVGYSCANCNHVNLKKDMKGREVYES